MSSNLKPLSLHSTGLRRKVTVPNRHLNILSPYLSAACTCAWAYIYENYLTFLPSVRFYQCSCYCIGMIWELFLQLECLLGVGAGHNTAHFSSISSDPLENMRQMLHPFQDCFIVRDLLEWHIDSFSCIRGNMNFINFMF